MVLECNMGVRMVIKYDIVLVTQGAFYILCRRVVLLPNKQVQASKCISKSA
jgi:hypothetical protein